MIINKAEVACKITVKANSIHIVAYDEKLSKLKTRKNITAAKVSPKDTGTRKLGPSIPTVVGIKQVKKADSHPNPILLVKT
jgi:hypothetical protein